MSTRRVAVVQAAPVGFDIDATVVKFERLLASAADQGAELVVFPEAFFSAYPRGSTFGAVVGERSPQGRDEYLRYWESAVEVPGPIIDRLGQAARAHHVLVVAGVIERDGGTLYCTVVFIDADGTFLGKHRKLMPTGAERMVWGMGDGSTMPVFDTAVGRVGAVICWENYMPLMRAAMFDQGIQIYCAPTADARDAWVSSMRHIALEGRCFVLSANQYVRRDDYPDDHPAGEGLSADDTMCRGGSLIVSPLGEILAGPYYDGETTLFADVDLKDVVRGKYDFDVAGHYSRPDVFHLTVDERSREQVSRLNAEPEPDAGDALPAP